MKPLRDYIIHVPNKYIEKWDTKSGMTLYRDTDMADAWGTYRVGEVKYIPDGDKSGMQPGDIAVFHHNIVLENIFKGRREPSDFLIDEANKLYKLPKELCYGFYHNDKFRAIEGFVFVKPETRKSVGSSVLIVDQKDELVPNHGYIKYGCTALDELGVKEGDRVMFADFCEYRFDIDKEELYRMHVSDILLKYE